MYTQEIVCPNCGKAAIVNVLDVEGNTQTPCQHCKTSISVYTNKEGKIGSVSKYMGGGGCFIATAACGDVDASEVIYLSSFRDEVLQQNVFGRSVIAMYYAISPSFAAIISKVAFLRAVVKLTVIKPVVSFLRLIWHSLPIER